MQWREALVIRLVDIGSCVHQLNSHSILAQVAGNVQSCVPKSIGLIDLGFRGEEKGSISLNKSGSWHKQPREPQKSNNCLSSLRFLTQKTEGTITEGKHYSDPFTSSRAPKTIPSYLRNRL